MPTEARKTRKRFMLISASPHRCTNWRRTVESQISQLLRTTTNMSGGWILRLKRSSGSLPESQTAYNRFSDSQHGSGIDPDKCARHSAERLSVLVRDTAVWEAPFT